MYKMLIVCVCVGFGFSQVLQVDSIIDPGTWTNPESIFVSDDLYGVPGGNNDNLVLGIADPSDTSATIDSVMVLLEQYVSDSTKAFWFVTPIINGNPGTSTPQQAGSEQESVLGFDISADITSWADIIALDIELTPIKGVGAPPEWYADYLYVYVYTDAGILEGEYGKANDSRLTIPYIISGALTFTYYLDTPSFITVEVYNSIGEGVLGKNVSGNIGKNRITLGGASELSTGVYYLQVKSVDSSIESGKFIILE